MICKKLVEQMMLGCIMVNGICHGCCVFLLPVMNRSFYAPAASKRFVIVALQQLKPSIAMITMQLKKIDRCVV
ncbi:MAG: hypothetical protein ABR512_10485 [Desulfopila sp.]